ncbi:MAG: hypothetical protein ISP24_04485 [Rickettsiales bacterium]|nr:hypothetical protein [Rickettsiales bacterium]
MRLRKQSRAEQTSEDPAMQEQKKVSAIKNMEENDALRPPLLEVENSFAMKVLETISKNNLSLDRSN